MKTFDEKKGRKKIFWQGKLEKWNSYLGGTLCMSFSLNRKYFCIFNSELNKLENFWENFCSSEWKLNIENSNL